MDISGHYKKGMSQMSHYKQQLSPYFHFHLTLSIFRLWKN